MPIANDKETKSIFQDMTSDETGSEASLGSEALLPDGRVFVPSDISPDVHPRPHVRRRGRQSLDSCTSGSNNVQNYHATKTGNIVFELSSMLHPSTDIHTDNCITDQAQLSHGNQVPGFDTEVSCLQRHNLNQQKGTSKLNMTEIESEQAENLIQTSCSQASFEARMDNFVPEVGQFSMESESERDTGFSSHSTSSSCQLETSPTEQEADSSWNYFPIDWSDAEADICLHGNNKIDDLIYHFDKFFRGQIENKLSEMGSFIHSLMTEQQTHVRYIVNTAVSTSASQTLTSVERDTSLGSPVRKLTRFSSGEEMSNSLFYITRDDERKRLLLKILSTSCAIGCVLLRPEFHT
ncbi:uncharacterized protein LOC132547886 [Ylistrum balloti]|uniref:uncharacterized protein LOC132547886 n=1 Tax=Ylistrum balloti TaxID=509963 RepID=UPI002905DE10|nr:uncharacterized protein LOC132547886 [Ylistrum balloti]